MKKITLLVGALMIITGTSFANDGKKDGAKTEACCKKDSKSGKDACCKKDGKGTTGKNEQKDSKVKEAKKEVKKA